MFKRACFVFCLLLSAHTAAQGKVWVVDDSAGPGIDFTTLPPAIATAAEGDTILVHPGNYHDLIDIDGKGLALIGPAQPDIAYTAGIRVRNLAAGRRVLLQNLTPRLEPLVATDLRILLEDNAGTVWIEGFTMPSIKPGGRAQFKNCAEVVLVRSVFEGGVQPSPAPDLVGSGIVGVHSIDSSVHAYGCEFVGGSGSVSGFIFYGSNGADAFQLKGGFLFAADCIFTGGDAGMIEGFVCLTEVSGDGLELTAGAAAPSASTLGGSFEAGEVDDDCSGSSFWTGEPVKIFAGTHQALAGVPCSLNAPAVVREGELLTVAFTGAPDAAAFLALSFVPDALYFPPFLGSLLLGPPYAVVLSATLPPSGSLQLDLPVGLLPPGTEMLLFHGQLGLFLTGGTFQLCSGSAVTLLDEQF
jgi:hypothetical protein